MRASTREPLTRPVQFFTGKGGVGKSTVLGAVATSAARAGFLLGGLFSLAVVIFLARFSGLCVNQSLPVSDRNLVVIGVNFRKCQETVTVSAIFNECCL